MLVYYYIIYLSAENVAVWESWKSKTGRIKMKEKTELSMFLMRENIGFSRLL